MQVLISYFFVSLLIVSCATSQEDQDIELTKGSKDFAEGLVSSVNTRWHTLAPEWAKLVGDDMKAPAHFFWDVNPEVVRSERTVNFVIENPEGSQNKYGIDITSGLHYTQGPYCEQSDIWKKSEEKIERPPFTIGIVPRVLDQLMMPQKIIVFGNGAYYRKYFRRNYFDARVVGAYIEQICPSGKCIGREKWKSRLVLIGVQNGNSDFLEVKNLRDLKQVIDWEQVKLFVENGQGKNIVLQKYAPGYRMGATVDSSQAFNFLSKHGHYFTIEKMKEMKVSCYKLYDYLYKNLGHENMLETSANSIQEVKAKTRALKENKVKFQKTDLFYHRFVKSFKKFHSQIKTCSTYVYPSNIKYDRDRHWFMTYILAFSKMHELGFVYDCSRRGWYPNPIQGAGRRSQALDRQMKYCTASSIDRAFESAVQTLGKERKSQRPSYRYITFDQGTIGTHNRMYSWVETDGKTLDCKKYKDFQAKIISFPKDIRWKQRNTQGKTKTELGDIIY